MSDKAALDGLPLGLSLGAYITRAAHIGFVVKEMESAVAGFKTLYGLGDEALRYEPGPEFDAPTRFAFFEIGGLEFELIEPLKEPFISQLFALDSGPGGINHVAWIVSDIEAALAAAQASGARPGYVTPAGIVAIGAKKMVYLDPATTGGLLIELIEEAV